MKAKKFTNCAQDILALACGSCIIFTILLIMNRDYPLVGHDYRYFIPRLIDTDLHLRLNGPAIQWYTPSFGGGLPAFANPQNIEYSIVQWCSYFINPWSAILLSTAAISLAGFYFLYKLLDQKLELHWMASTLGAMFFIGNGFYIEHLIVGHLGYQLFPLGAIVLYALIDSRNKLLLNSAGIAIVVALFIHQAGFYLLIILMLSLGMALPILFLYKPAVLNLKKITQTIVISIILSMTMIASKVSAVYALMRHFPREIFDSYNVSFLQGLVGIIVQLLGTMALGPIVLLTGNNPDLLSGAFGRITGSEYGIWEIDAGLSPLLLVFLFIGLTGALRNIRTGAKLQLARSQIISLIILTLAIWMTVEMTLAKGIIYGLTKQLPMLKSLHVNVRFAAAFIIPLIIVGAFQLHRYFSAKPRLLYFFAGALLTNAFLLSFFSLSSEVHSRHFSVKFSNSLNEQIQNGMRFQVIDITDKPDWEGFSPHSSTYRPYEPVFGYSLESFSPKVHPGSVFETSDGYFNMTNPVSLVFPEANNLHPFERIKVSERDKLEIFLERGQPEWNIPMRQKALNILSLLAVIFSVGVLLSAGAARIKASFGHGSELWQVPAGNLENEKKW